MFFFINIGIRVIYPNLIWVYTVEYGLRENDIAVLFFVIGIGAILGVKFGANLIGRFKDRNITIISCFTLALFSFSLTMVSYPYIHAAVWGLSAMMQSVIVVTFLPTGSVL